MRWQGRGKAQEDILLFGPAEIDQDIATEDQVRCWIFAVSHDVVVLKFHPAPYRFNQSVAVSLRTKIFVHDRRRDFFDAGDVKTPGSGRFQDRMTWKGYRSGHMMYLHDPSLQKFRNDLVGFIRATDRL